VRLVGNCGDLRAVAGRMGGIAAMVGELSLCSDKQSSPIKNPTLEVGLEIIVISCD